MTSVPADAVDFPLAPEQRRLLLRGLNEWGGPAKPTEAVLRMFGLDTTHEFYEMTERLYQLIESGTALQEFDWVTALLLTELAFVSDVLGTGVHWPTTTGMSDSETIAVLRSLQRTLRA